MLYFYEHPLKVLWYQGWDILMITLISSQKSPTPNISAASVWDKSELDRSMCLSQLSRGTDFCPPKYYLPFPGISDLPTALSWIHQQCYSRTFHIDIQYCKFLHFAKQKLVWIIVKLQNEVVKTWIFVFEKPVENKIEGTPILVMIKR